MNDLSELIQDDIRCLLDGLPDELITAACQIVVDRFAAHEQREQTAKI
jgi:hypothetical protein